MEFQWLEELESPQSLQWVQDQNARTLSEMKSHADFSEFYSEALKLHASSGKLPYRLIRDGLVYDLQISKENPLGLWCRCSIEEFQNENPKWDVLFDFDLFSRTAGREWNYGGAMISPSGNRTLLSLSDGGKDACWIREFDFPSKRFVEKGFEVPLSKAKAVWADDDTLIVGGDTSESQNRSGYASALFLWKRNQSHRELLVDSPKNELGFYLGTRVRNEKHLLIWQVQNYDANIIWYWTPKEGAKRLFLPPGVESVQLFGEKIVFALGRSYEGIPSGTVLAVPLVEALTNETPSFETVWSPSKEIFFDSLVAAQNGLLVVSKKDVCSRLEYLTPDGKTWKSEPQTLPEGLEIYGLERDAETKKIYLRMESFFVPPSLIEWTPEGTHLLKSLPPLFDGKYFVVQDWVVSPDGTKVPYFLVRRRDIPLKQEVPTLLYGYGGFQISLTPSYSATLGKLWLERGGAYVVANIRGGGEFGAEWNLAARKENKQRSYDDFIAVAEALIAQGLTRPSKLAILGGSNGGLLVGAVAMQRPELFGAVLCTIPLLDMIRYADLPPGSLWIDEFGDPKEAAMREVILKYSPYHNIDGKKKYPKILFMTSRTDDRVHPGHARKMVAKMQSLGKDCYLYEESSGGHGGGNQEVRALDSAIKYSYLWKMLS